MKLLEYQAKDMLSEYGIPVPQNVLLKGLTDLKNVVNKFNGKVVVKAQVLAGGRGKSGGVVLADGFDEAHKAATGLLGRRLVTYQTNEKGEEVSSLLIEEQTKIKKEIYLSITYDRENQKPVFMISEEGGVEIEEIAVTHPEKIIKVWADPLTGIQAHHVRRLFTALNLDKSLFSDFQLFVTKLYEIYMEKDAAMIEINPLILDGNDKFMALDAKIIIDDNALFRAPALTEIRKVPDDEKQEVEAKEKGLSFVSLDGDVACMVNGAGLAMATMDIIKHYGMEPANVLDIGGSSNPQKVIEALDIIMKNPRIKVIFINVFGGITRCDDVANGFKTALEKMNIKLPIVIRLTGTNEAEGRKILDDMGYNTFTGLKESIEKLSEVYKQSVKEG